jgi:hypothetical protein
MILGGLVALQTFLRGRPRNSCQLTETLLSGMLPVVLFTIGGNGFGVACA